MLLIEERAPIHLRHAQRVASMHECETVHRVQVKGLVIPAEWDGDGRVTAVAISSFDEGEYVPAKNRLADELLSLIHQRVNVSGRLMGGERGRHIIDITEYRVMMD